jgi:hypothetical protein
MPRMATATKPGTEISVVNAERSGSSPARTSYTVPRRPAAGGCTSEYVGAVLPEGLADEFGVPEDQRPAR